MSEGINKVILLGNLGVDPDLRVVAGGNAVCKLKVATTERYQSNGSWQEKTEWHQVAVWGRMGEACSENLGKGSKVYVEGSITTRTYEKDGEKRYSTEIRAHKVLFLGGNHQAERGANSRRQQRRDPPRRVSEDDFQHPDAQQELPEPDGF